MSTIPTITKQDIRTFVGEQNFLKGQQYMHDGAIVDPVQQGMSLKAYCYGSLPEPYRVQATYDDSGITTALCSCSAGTAVYMNRHCQHAAALLLAWDVALKAAERTEETYPRASLDLYQQHVERLIAGRGRANYQVACNYLIKIRSLYEKLDETGQWATYIAWLRKRHSRLSTLKEELTAASL